MMSSAFQPLRALVPRQDAAVPVEFVNREVLGRVDQPIFPRVAGDLRFPALEVFKVFALFEHTPCEKDDRRA